MFKDQGIQKIDTSQSVCLSNLQDIINEYNRYLSNKRIEENI